MRSPLALVQWVALSGLFLLFLASSLGILDTADAADLIVTSGTDASADASYDDAWIDSTYWMNGWDIWIDGDLTINETGSFDGNASADLTVNGSVTVQGELNMDTGTLHAYSIYVGNTGDLYFSKSRTIIEMGLQTAANAEAWHQNGVIEFTTTSASSIQLSTNTVTTALYSVIVSGSGGTMRLHNDGMEIDNNLIVQSGSTIRCDTGVTDSGIIVGGGVIVNGTLQMSTYGDGADSSFGYLYAESGSDVTLSSGITTLTNKHTATGRTFCTISGSTFDANGGTVELDMAATVYMLSQGTGNIYNLHSIANNAVKLSASITIDNDLTVDAGTFHYTYDARDITVLGDTDVTGTLGHATWAGTCTLAGGLFIRNGGEFIGSSDKNYLGNTVLEAAYPNYFYDGSTFTGGSGQYWMGATRVEGATIDLSSYEMYFVGKHTSSYQALLCNDPTVTMNHNNGHVFLNVTQSELILSGANVEYVFYDLSFIDAQGPFSTIRMKYGSGGFTKFHVYNDFYVDAGLEARVWSIPTAGFTSFIVDGTATIDGEFDMNIDVNDHSFGSINIGASGVFISTEGNLKISDEITNNNGDYFHNDGTMYFLNGAADYAIKGDFDSSDPLHNLRVDTKNLQIATGTSSTLHVEHDITGGKWLHFNVDQRLLLGTNFYASQVTPKSILAYGSILSFYVESVSEDYPATIDVTDGTVYFLEDDAYSPDAGVELKWVNIADDIDTLNADLVWTLTGDCSFAGIIHDGTFDQNGYHLTIGGLFNNQGTYTIGSGGELTILADGNHTLSQNSVYGNVTLWGDLLTADYDLIVTYQMDVKDTGRVWCEASTIAIGETNYANYYSLISRGEYYGGSGEHTIGTLNLYPGCQNHTFTSGTTTISSKNYNSYMVLYFADASSWHNYGTVIFDKNHIYGDGEHRVASGNTDVELHLWNVQIVDGYIQLMASFGVYTDYHCRLYIDGDLTIEAGEKLYTTTLEVNDDFDFHVAGEVTVNGTLDLSASSDAHSFGGLWNNGGTVALSSGTTEITAEAGSSNQYSIMNADTFDANGGTVDITGLEGSYSYIMGFTLTNAFYNLHISTTGGDYVRFYNTDVSNDLIINTGAKFFEHTGGTRELNVYGGAYVYGILDLGDNNHEFGWLFGYSGSTIYATSGFINTTSVWNNYRLNLDGDFYNNSGSVVCDANGGIVDANPANGMYLNNLTNTGFSVTGLVARCSNLTMYMDNSVSYNLHWGTIRCDNFYLTKGHLKTSTNDDDLIIYDSFYIGVDGAYYADTYGISQFDHDITVGNEWIVNGSVGEWAGNGGPCDGSWSAGTLKINSGATFRSTVEALTVGTFDNNAGSGYIHNNGFLETTGNFYPGGGVFWDYKKSITQQQCWESCTIENSYFNNRITNIRATIWYFGTVSQSATIIFGGAGDYFGTQPVSAPTGFYAVDEDYPVYFQNTNINHIRFQGGSADSVLKWAQFNYTDTLQYNTNLVLVGNCAFTGLTVESGSAINLNSNTLSTEDTVIIANGATFNINGGHAYIDDFIHQGDWTTTGDLTINGTGSFQDLYVTSGDTLEAGNATGNIVTAGCLWINGTYSATSETTFVNGSASDNYWWKTGGSAIFYHNSGRVYGCHEHGRRIYIADVNDAPFWDIYLPKRPYQMSSVWFQNNHTGYYWCHMTEGSTTWIGDDSHSGYSSQIYPWDYNVTVRAYNQNYPATVNYIRHRHGSDLNMYWLTVNTYDFDHWDNTNAQIFVRGDSTIVNTANIIDSADIWLHGGDLTFDGNVNLQLGTSLNLAGQRCTFAGSFISMGTFTTGGLSAIELTSSASWDMDRPITVSELEIDCGDFVIDHNITFTGPGFRNSTGSINVTGSYGDLIYITGAPYWEINTDTIEYFWKYVNVTHGNNTGSSALVALGEGFDLQGPWDFQAPLIMPHFITEDLFIDTRYTDILQLDWTAEDMSFLYALNVTISDYLGTVIFTTEINESTFGETAAFRWNLSVPIANLSYGRLLINYTASDAHNPPASHKARKNADTMLCDLAGELVGKPSGKDKSEKQETNTIKFKKAGPFVSDLFNIEFLTDNKGSQHKVRWTGDNFKMSHWVKLDHGTSVPMRIIADAIEHISSQEFGAAHFLINNDYFYDASDFEATGGKILLLDQGTLDGKEYVTISFTHPDWKKGGGWGLIDPLTGAINSRSVYYNISIGTIPEVVTPNNNSKLPGDSTSTTLKVRVYGAGPFEGTIRFYDESGVLLGTQTNVTNNTVALVELGDLDEDILYHWYTVLSVGGDNFTSPTWNFRTGGLEANSAPPGSGRERHGDSSSDLPDLTTVAFFIIFITLIILITKLWIGGEVNKS